MFKALRKAVMHRSKLKKSIYNKKRADVNWVNYRKQPTEFLCTLLRRTKKDYFQNLNAKDLSNNTKLFEIMNSPLKIKD